LSTLADFPSPIIFYLNPYLAIGWNQQKRIYGTTIHLDIQDEKIWIQQNTTEFDLASDLVEMGVPKQDIVIGFHTPKMRQLTGFAIG
jgi:XisI protein